MSESKVERVYKTKGCTAWWPTPLKVMPHDVGTILLHNDQSVGDFEPWMVDKVMTAAREQESRGWTENARELRDIADAIAKLFEEGDDE